MSVDWITLALGGCAIACAVGVWSLTRPTNEPRRAVDHYEGLVRRNPNDYASRYELALAYMRRGQLMESIAELRTVVELAPKHAPAHYSLGVALLTSGNHTAALSHLERATSLSPIYADAHASLGALHHMRGDATAAKAALIRATSLDPTLAIAHFNLARCYAQEHNVDKTIECLRAAIKQDPAMRAEAKCGNDFDHLMGEEKFRQFMFAWAPDRQGDKARGRVALVPSDRSTRPTTARPRLR